MHILGLPTDIFNVYPASIKYKTYQARWQIGDIYVSGDARKTEDNPQGLGCYLVMTGRGCDDIFRILDSRNYTFGDMFRRCERRYGLDNFHFTRLDIAIDDKNEKPFFTIEQIKKKCEKEEFISNSEGYHFDESKFDDFDTAKTVYIGAGNLDYPTAFMIRIRKSVQNIIRHLMKSAVGNGQKCNCVMIRLMLLP